MDFKGITWAGNIYQKFETMCNEVEEVMYQDTVKYMENQVQKVGGSVKKFYSEIMQDLLPLSCVQPVKVAAASQDPSSIPNANTDTDEKENEDESIFDVGAEKESPKKIPSYNIRSLSKISPGVVVPDKRPEFFSVRTKKTGAHKSLGIKRISRNNHALKDSCETKNSSAVKTRSDDAVTLSSDAALRFDLESPLKGKIFTSETPLETPSSDKDLSAESLRQEKGDSKYMSVTSDNNTSADSVVRQIERASEHASSHILPTESNGAYVVSDALNVESENDDALTSNEDEFELELIENEQVTDPREDISEHIETSKLDESCVFIEGNTLIQHVSEGTMKHKSYKQKIHKAFLSKLRSTKKQHRLVSEYKDLGGKKPALDMTSSEKRILSADDDALESDWEIL